MMIQIEAVSPLVLLRRTALLAGLVATDLAGLLSPASAGPPAAGNAILSAEVVGTSFRITLADGRVLGGSQLVGATLALMTPGSGIARRVRIDDIVPDERDPDHEVLLYRVSVLDAEGLASELCEPDPQGKRWAFPLKGQWDSEGNRISAEGFTLTCSAGAQGKCVRFGYKPWKRLPDGTDLADYHRACVKLIRADYCGDHATTRNGMPIDIYDRIGIQQRATTAGQDGLRFEAAWGTGGALCVAHTRVPAKMTLAGLARSCPRLADRLGPVACTAEQAEAGRLGPALLFDRSP